ncbi:MAG TPA: FGGY family carbohydrate kinase, partial [Lentisphaeria bacterium]|nr:FGGY family carbohydrate kinase [Lentisphaeria bacterium]
MNSQSHIAIDLGAGSGRIMLGVRQKNEIQLVEAARFSYAMQPVDGVLCWDYQELLNNLIDAFHVVCSKLDATPQSISCDSWAQDFALLDADGKVCGEIVSYREQRTVDMPQHIAAIVPPEELNSRIGRKTAGSFSTLGQLKFLAEHKHGLLDRASTLLHIADLIHYELCGN